MQFNTELHYRKSSTFSKPCEGDYWVLFFLEEQTCEVLSGNWCKGSLCFAGSGRARTGRTKGYHRADNCSNTQRGVRSDTQGWDGKPDTINNLPRLLSLPLQGRGPLAGVTWCATKHLQGQGSQVLQKCTFADGKSAVQTLPSNLQLL